MSALVMEVEATWIYIRILMITVRILKLSKLLGRKRKIDQICMGGENSRGMFNGHVSQHFPSKRRSVPSKDPISVLVF
jgi:hypothetical protein